MKRVNDKVTQQWLQKYITNTMNTVGKYIDKDIKSTNEDMKSNLEKIYKDYIRTFYDYPTKSYIRTGESKPGTRRGWTLYQGLYTKTNYKHGRGGQRLNFDLMYTEESWEKVYKPKYFYPAREFPEEVLGNVVNNKRFVNPDTGYVMNWKPDSYSESFLTTNGESINNFLHNFDVNFDSIASDVFETYWVTTRSSVLPQLV